MNFKTLLLTLCLALGNRACLSADEFREIQFAGVLSQPSRTGEQQILRRFEVLLFGDGGNRDFFVVMDHERDGCSWPECFGTVHSAAGPSPHLLYTFDGNVYSLPLPPLSLSLPDDLNSETEWAKDGWTYTVLEKSSGAGRELSWKISASERRGRKQQLTVSDSGLLMSAVQDVFMGQGDRFELALTQTARRAVNDPATVGQLFAKLTELQRALNRRADTQQTGLSSRQVSDALTFLPELNRLAMGTPLQEFVLRIEKDLKLQQRRVDTSEKRQGQLMNKPSPEFSLNLISGGSLQSGELKGKTVVLHFWSYSDRPLTEPYGQVGYLEFLYSREKEKNVSVIGVSTNSSLLAAEQSSAGRRAARKLVEFMNLNYPIGYDDGSLLRELGDPRDMGAELPLWVVISPAGKIVHYHSGYYEIDRQHGLKQLLDVLSAHGEPGN
ncbi:MAG: TlpA family protein disulfide reductase [Planctomycetaceae bacterium]|nr:TlpA family protein disulfide reductase [Planctomycetaceae bacterium]